jgi:hypothetical protein
MFKIIFKNYLKTKLFLILRVALLFIIPIVKAQDTDYIANQNIQIDTLYPTKKDTLKQSHSPKKAAIMSAVLPGLGQAYNKKYWKIPIIYAGLGTLGYLIKYNSVRYSFYRRAYLAKIDDEPSTVDEYPFVSENGLLQRLNQHRRTRDLLVVGAALFYALNIIDASVDAHLFEFDISDNLSFHIEPIIFSNMFITSTYSGFRIKLNF